MKSRIYFYFSVSFPGRKTILTSLANSWLKNVHGLPPWSKTMLSRHYHIAVTCPVLVASLKTIVIVGYYHDRSQNISFRWLILSTRSESETYCTLCLVSDAILSIRWIIYRPHCRESYTTPFLTLQPRVEFKTLLTENQLHTKPPVELAHCSGPGICDILLLWTDVYQESRNTIYSQMYPIV